MCILDFWNPLFTSLFQLSKRFVIPSTLTSASCLLILLDAKSTSFVCHLAWGKMSHSFPVLLWQRGTLNLLRHTSILAHFNFPFKFWICLTKLKKNNKTSCSSCSIRVVLMTTFSFDTRPFWLCYKIGVSLTDSKTEWANSMTLRVLRLYFSHNKPQDLCSNR